MDRGVRHAGSKLIRSLVPVVRATLSSVPGRRVHAAALKPGHDRLRCLHALGQFGLGEPGPGAGLDQRAGQGELRAESIIRLALFRVPNPLLVQVGNLAHVVTSTARRRRQFNLPAWRSPGLLHEHVHYHDAPVPRRDLKRAQYVVPPAQAHFPERASKVPDMRCAHALQTNDRNLLAYGYEPRPHIGGQRMEFQIHGLVQGLDAPIHRPASSSSSAIIPNSCFDPARVHEASRSDWRKYFTFTWREDDSVLRTLAGHRNHLFNIRDDCFGDYMPTKQYP